MFKTCFKACALSMLFGVLSVCNAFSATPQISTVTGTVQNGSILTVNGQYLVDEDKTNWISMLQSGSAYGFEGSSYTSDGYGAAPDANRAEPTYDSNVKLMGSKSYKGHVTGASSNCPAGNRSAGAYVSAGGSDIYVRMYSRWYSAGTSSKWPASHIKMLDVQGTGDQLYFQPAAGGNLPTQMSMIYNSSTHNYTVNNFLQQNRWYCMEAHFKASSPTNFTAWVDGVQLANVNNVSVGSIQYVLFGLINLCDTGSDFDLSHWIDNFAVSTTRIFPSSTIEVGNSSDYASSTKVYQEPVLLSDGSVQIKLNLTGLGAGPYYLWVTNNRQARSAAFSLSGAGGGGGSSSSDTTAPTVSIASPIAGTTVAGNLTISASASDNVSVNGVQFKIDGQNLGSQDTSSPYSVILDTTTLTNGSHTLTALATDSSGNSTTSNSVTINIQNTAASVSSTLFTENFENANFASRGWYDNTGLQLSSVEHITGSNNSVEFHFTQGATQPTSGGAIRKKFTETDSVYLSYWVKYSANWTGSNQTYHPHEFMLMTNKNGDWDGLAYTYLTVYVEQNEGEPLFAIQDGQNIDENRVGQNLVNVTENRSVAGCNGDSDGYGNGECYVAGSGHWNGKMWRAGSIYFQDTAGAYYKNNWHFIEAYIKLNSISGGKGAKDGIIRYWYDGQLIIDHSNVVMRTAQNADMMFNQFVIAPWIGDGSPIDQTFWIDGLTVATGLPGGTGGTSVTVPANLRVVQ